MTEEAFTIDQFVGVFKLGRTSVFEEIKTGRLPTYTIGRRRFISARAAAEWQRRLEAEAAERQGVAAPSEIRP